MPANLGGRRQRRVQGSITAILFMRTPLASWFLLLFVCICVSRTVCCKRCQSKNTLLYYKQSACEVEHVPCQIRFSVSPVPTICDTHSVRSHFRSSIFRRSPQPQLRSLSTVMASDASTPQTVTPLKRAASSDALSSPRLSIASGAVAHDGRLSKRVTVWIGGLLGAQGNPLGPQGVFRRLVYLK